MVKCQDSEDAAIKSSNKTKLQEIDKQKNDKKVKLVTTTESNTNQQEMVVKPQIRPLSVRVKKMSAKQRLRSHLMTDYDKRIHPAEDHTVEDHTKAVNVSLGMALIHVELDEKKSIMIVDGWMRMTWVDPNLTWNKTDFDDVAMMHFG